MCNMFEGLNLFPFEPSTVAVAMDTTRFMASKGACFLVALLGFGLMSKDTALLLCSRQPPDFKEIQPMATLESQSYIGRGIKVIGTPK